MNFFVVAQYVPRVFRIYRSCQDYKKSSKEETPIWLKGLLNFFLYIFASHVSLNLILTISCLVEIRILQSLFDRKSCLSSHR